MERHGGAVDKPVPPISADVDLKDFAFTPIYRARLFGSAFHATVSDAAWRAGVTLWLKSWDQVPAGSLPIDEVALCRLAELGRDLRTWRKISFEALHGWDEHADGRLYHKVVAEGVRAAWQKKCAQRDRTEAARAARAAKRLSQTENDAPTVSVTENVTDDVTGSKGQGQGQGQGQGDKNSTPHETSETPTRALRAPARYAFNGAIIRLTQADFDRWKSSYSAIPDLTAELETIDAKYVDEGFEGKWFSRTSGWLRARHEELRKRQNDEDELYRGVL